jgi:cobalt-precorrin-5B (C1)-methyltransferase
MDTLKRGYTTGTCAAAAAKAAAEALLGGAREGSDVAVRTPQGTVLRLMTEDLRCDGSGASCAVRKDAGDDPDVTHGVLVYARVEKRGDPGDVALFGGEGVGQVTLPGLDAPVGGPAINSVPRAMIRENLREVCARYGYGGGIAVTISIPGGAELARRTFNPSLGVIGGLSILGTTGIVEPMSDRGLLGTIKAELSVRRAMGETRAVITPGNYGIRFLSGWEGAGKWEKIPPVKCGNFIGDTLDMAGDAGFGELLVAGHIGKLIKLAVGAFNTHSKYGDGRLEILTAYAGTAGADRPLMESLMACATTDHALALLESAGLWEAVFSRVREAVQSRLDRRACGTLSVGAAFFSSARGFLGLSRPVSDGLSKAACCFRMVQHRVRLLH